jgi:hypothetical protein
MRFPRCSKYMICQDLARRLERLEAYLASPVRSGQVLSYPEAWTAPPSVSWIYGAIRAWDGGQTADKELNDAKGKDKTTYTAALGAFGERRKEYHRAVEALRGHRAEHGCQGPLPAFETRRHREERSRLEMRAIAPAPLQVFVAPSARLSRKIHQRSAAPFPSSRCHC